MTYILIVVIGLLSIFLGAVQVPVPFALGHSIPPLTIGGILGIGFPTALILQFQGPLSALEEWSPRSFRSKDWLLATPILAVGLLLGFFEPAYLRNFSLLCIILLLIGPILGKLTTISLLVCWLIVQSALYRILEHPLWMLVTILLQEARHTPSLVFFGLLLVTFQFRIRRFKISN